MRHHNYEEHFYSGSSHNEPTVNMAAIKFTIGEHDSKCNTLPTVYLPDQQHMSALSTVTVVHMMLAATAQLQ